jgi:hypothetical protein
MSAPPAGTATTPMTSPDATTATPTDTTADQATPPEQGKRKKKR